MSSDPERFGALLRRLRQAKALTQGQLGERAGISEKTISRLERGNKAPRAANVRELIKVLEPDDLMEEEFIAATIWAKKKPQRQQSTNASLPASPESPVLPTPDELVGRERERDEIVERFLRGQRFLVVTGPGGVGKTRLASAVAQVLNLHSWMELPTVDCASLHLAAGVRIDLADRISETVSRVERERPDTQGETIREGQSAIPPIRYLLRLENVETIGDTSVIFELVSLLERIPSLALLLTSRRSLRLKRQDEYPIDPLSIGAAKLLFYARAAVQGVSIDRESDSDIGKLCERLDRLPLAIELAAGRTDQYSPRTLLERLQHPLELLIGGPQTAPLRQWTLRDTIAWSYELLAPSEQHVLRCLALSAFDTDLRAAEAICGQIDRHDVGVGNALMGLVDHNLIRLERQEAGGRYSMLLMIREYALEQLTASGEQAIVRDRYIRHYATLASSLQGVDVDGSWYPSMALEHDNLHLALNLASESGNADQALGLCLDLTPYWLRRGSRGDAQRHLRHALTLDAGLPAYHHRVIEAAFTLKLAEGGLSAALAVAEEMLSQAYSRGDQGREAIVHVLLGVGFYMAGDYKIAKAHLSEHFAMVEALLEPRYAIMSATTLALIAASQGDEQVAEKWLDAPSIGGRNECTSYDNALLQATRGEIFLLQGATAEARASITQAMVLSREARDDLGYARAEGVLGRIAFLEGDFVEAERLVTDALQRQELSGNWPALVTSLLVLGDVAQACHDRKSAEWHYGMAAELAQKIGTRLGMASALEGLAASAIEPIDGHAADFPRAARLLGAAMNLRRDVGTPVPLSDRSRHEYLRDRLSPTIGEEGLESIRERVGTFPEDDLSSGTSAGF